MPGRWRTRISPPRTGHDQPVARRRSNEDNVEEQLDERHRRGIGCPDAGPESCAHVGSQADADAQSGRGPEQALASFAPGILTERFGSCGTPASRRSRRATFCHHPSVELTIRPARPDDVEDLVALSSRVWEPVFTSVNQVLGHELAQLLHGEDWRDHQAKEVREILNSDSTRSTVAEVDGELVGFVAARVVDLVRRIGEVQIVGVDPSAQRHGVGTALVRDAEAWLREKGMEVAFIGTGGDPGHAPARRLYASMGYTLLPSAQYFRVLRDEG